MEEQKNSINPLINPPAEAAAPKGIPTVAGAMIILIVAVLVGAGVFYLIQADSAQNYSSAVISSKSSKAKIGTTETLENKETGTAPEVLTAGGTAAEPAAGATFNFDYELKKLDEQNNSISSDDFNETEMSDANIGV